MLFSTAREISYRIKVTVEPLSWEYVSPLFGGRKVEIMEIRFQGGLMGIGMSPWLEAEFARTVSTIKPGMRETYGGPTIDSPCEKS